MLTCPPLSEEASPSRRAAFRRRICAKARRLQQDPLFRYDPVVDQAALQRDGVIVLPGIFTESATERLIVACKNVQNYNDEWVNKDWLEPSLQSAWAAAGLRPPSSLASPELRAALTGGTQLGSRDSTNLPGIFDGSDFIGLQDDKRVPFLQGFCPEAFACGYDAMLLNAYTHPQMLALQRQMLGPELRFDHCLVFNRKAGFKGGSWHTHAYSEDGLGPTTRNPTVGEARTLIYPEGFAAKDDGGLSIVRGGHLLRDHTMRADGDEAMDSWLKGKNNPLTGEPLVRERLALPSGSLVAALTHAPHMVAKRIHGVRYGALFAYANPDSEKRLPRGQIRANQSELTEQQRKENIARPNYLRRSAAIPTTHADFVPKEWTQLAKAGHVPGIDPTGRHERLFTESA
eukprot:SAG31_NODE_5945_length_2246_cov_3.237075_2_plen_402_part_00